VGIAGLEHAPHHPNLRLRGGGLFQRVDATAGKRRDWGQLELGNGPRLPGRESLIELADDLGRLDVAGDGDDRVVGHPEARVKSGQFFRGYRTDRLRRAPRRLSPGMLRAEEDAAASSPASAPRLAFFCS